MPKFGDILPIAGWCGFGCLMAWEQTLQAADRDLWPASRKNNSLAGIHPEHIHSGSQGSRGKHPPTGAFERERRPAARDQSGAA
jgi:hypothetical protein